MRGCNLLSNLSVLAPNAASDGVQGAGGLRSAPPAGTARLQGPWRSPARSAWDGLPADALRWSAPGLADHPHGLSQRPRHRQQVSMATAAREQHEVRGGTSVAPSSQERPTPAGVTARRRCGAVRPGVSDRHQQPVIRGSVAVGGRSGLCAWPIARSPPAAPATRQPGNLSSSSPRSALQRRRVHARTTYKLRLTA
jgi:hypothetical protein